MTAVVESPSTVLVSVSDAVGTITINRPRARNALNMEVKRDLAAAVALVRDRPDVRSVILTGAEGTFCSGGDIAEMELNDTPVTSRSRLARLLDEVIISLAEIEKPTVAAIEGHAHGAGLSLALACDLIVVAEDALLSCAFGAIGLVPDCGALYFLPRRLPMGVAKELVFTGRRFSGVEAGELGLANRVTASGTALTEAQDLAAMLARGATVALGLSKSIMDSATTMTLRELAQVEALAQAIAYSTEDHVAAREAFKDRSPVRFSGR